MQITYFGDDQFFLSEAFSSADDRFEPEPISFGSTEIVLENSDTGAITTLTGSGFSLAGNGEPNGGVITSIEFFDTVDGPDDLVTVAVIDGITWTLVDFVEAFDDAIEDGDLDAVADLFSQDGPIVFDASAATLWLDMFDFTEAFRLVTEPVQVTGSRFDDYLVGTPQNDTFDPGENDGYDVLKGSEGSDTYDLGAGTPGSYYALEYNEIDGPITVSINTVLGTATITDGDFTDRILNIRTATFEDSGDGIEIAGTGRDDTFTIRQADRNWMALSGGDGDDTFNLQIEDGGTVRIYNSWDGGERAETGVTANLATGIVEDAFGGEDTINVSGDGRLEFGGTDFADEITGSARRESFISNGGNDTIDGGGGIDRIRYDRSRMEEMVIDLELGRAEGSRDGVAFVDTLRNIEEARGSRVNDTIRGSSDDDRLEGRQGDDVVSGRGGDDTIEGDAGNDTLNGNDGDDRLEGDLGDDLIDGGEGDDRVVVGATLENAEVTENADGSIVIASAAGTDTYVNIETFIFDDVRLDVDDLLEAGGSGGVPGDSVQGTDGDDTLTATVNDDTVTGGGGNDTIDGDFGDDGVFGQDGDDVLDGGRGNDNIAGSVGNDAITGGSGRDSIGGGEGNDSIAGETGDDTIGGGVGDDRIDGGAGDDVLAAGAGDDGIIGGAGNDTIGGSYGSDSVGGGSGDDSLGGGFGMDLVEGGDGNDSIGGGEGNDTVRGDDDDDFLAGGGRNDIVDGGEGNDTINGGSGNDTLTGGSGADQFNWISTDNIAGDVDVVTDFEDGVDTLLFAGVANAPGSGLAGRVETLSIDDTTFNGQAAAEIEYEGQTVVLLGVSADALGVDDFLFV
ncbi:Bifunctional hemolysin/adenylate cyclase precursor [Roseivivax jejudonensis]|uniref:Bifunctional hemolysin/adenylate cyclase n=1 Tax=Roseivivax jejudonensis TaxID=1529041 RepID=A0A1X6ZNG9_9RHOB|nr:calcium-binding protein [Roseivivax jejudonensis]SLN56759.1 Bifunctional hemolysin/adenylate cyclase precursor [Roseivivax jejudonensis]